MKILDVEISRKGENDTYDDDENEFIIDVDRVKRFLNEYEVLNQIDHPNIIKTYGFFFGDAKHSPSILLEFCPSNLKKRIKKLQEEERISIIVEIASAMKKVHEEGIIHRDLKLENILLDDQNNVKLSDFGLCTLIENDTLTTSRTQMAGTLCYMAPELLNRSKNYDEKVDVYSFGVVLFLILNNGVFPEIGLLDVGAGKQADIPDCISDFSKHLIQMCWSFKPSDRPSFADICDMLDNENKYKLIKA